MGTPDYTYMDALTPQTQTQTQTQPQTDIMAIVATINESLRPATRRVWAILDSSPTQARYWDNLPLDSTNPTYFSEEV